MLKTIYLRILADCIEVNYSSQVWYKISGGGDGRPNGCFEIEARTDTAKFPNVRIAI